MATGTTLDDWIWGRSESIFYTSKIHNVSEDVSRTEYHWVNFIRFHLCHPKSSCSLPWSQQFALCSVQIGPSNCSHCFVLWSESHYCPNLQLLHLTQEWRARLQHSLHAHCNWAAVVALMLSSYLSGSLEVLLSGCPRWVCEKVKAQRSGLWPTRDGRQG